MEFNMTVSANSESCHETLPPCILYQRDQVTLIDIPCSIAAAQNASSQRTPWRRMLRSVAPLTSSFPNNEPKSDAARSRLKAKMGTEFDTLYSQCISDALLNIHQNYQSDWCLPRPIALQPPVHGKKRKASDLNQSETPHETSKTNHDPGHVAAPAPEQQSTQTLSEGHEKSKGLEPCHSEGELSVLLRLLASGSTPQVHASPPLLTLHWTTNEQDQSESVIVHDGNTDRCWGHHVHNSGPNFRRLRVTTNHLEPISFYIPPGAHLFLGDCSNPRPFHLAVQDQARAEGTAAQFDVVVMDPPWPNSSVSRARKSGTAYETAPTMWDIRQLLFGMDIDFLLSMDGLIAIWITNRPAVRDLVLGEDGLFESWGVDLEEEWLWIKTTRSGDPVSSPNSYWRKPYEVLLLGRKHALRDDNVGVNKQVKRRVIAGVPDLHSRKPCLRELIEPLMPDPTSYRALEVFARHLVAGWWSWGNEVIKFNHERCWVEIKHD